MKVLPEELLVHLGSYPRDAGGDKCVEAAETEAHFKVSRKRAGRNASEARASLEKDDVGVEPFKMGRRPLRWTWPNQQGPSAGRGNRRSTHASIFWRHGRPALDARQLANGERRRLEQESEGLVVPMKSVNTDGGKGPWFRVWLGRPRIRRSA
jgi:hypothetical protein